MTVNYLILAIVHFIDFFVWVIYHENNFKNLDIWLNISHFDFDGVKMEFINVSKSCKDISNFKLCLMFPHVSVSPKL